MKKFSRIGSCLISISVLLSSVMMPTYATGDANVVIGKKLSFEEDNAPFIYEERTMIPLRAVSEALDATVFWFGNTSTIQIVNYDTLLVLQIGNGLMAKYRIENGETSDECETIQLEVVPMIHICAATCYF